MRRSRVDGVLVEETVQVGSHYILGTSSHADDLTWVLKEADTFAVLDRSGDIRTTGLGEQGLFHEGTRFLSRLEIECYGLRPMLLSSCVREGNALLVVDMTNADVYREHHLDVPRQSIHLFRSKLLRTGACHERLQLRNHTTERRAAVVRVRFAADFHDIFEVRGFERTRRGDTVDPLIEGATVTLGYIGLDGVTRRTRLHFSPRPTELTRSDARWDLDLGPGQAGTLYLAVSCQIGPEPPVVESFNGAQAAVSSVLQSERERAVRIESSDSRFNAWMERSFADLHLLVTNTDTGPYPYAGVPWFCTLFGRDGLITALESLWVDPEIARGVLARLAAYQATHVDEATDAEPGKILHETRSGELAATREIPFGRYYGSIDATPLFLMLLAAYAERSGDLAFVRTIWPAAERALEWMDAYGDRDGDGFLEYASNERGLRHQGWKDSANPVFHADGAPAEGPVALCEVQGYAYAARCGMARLASRLGHEELAVRQTVRASELRHRFEEAFWCDAIGSYAIALDGNKRQCRVRSSNAGQCLYTGIVAAERARLVTGQLLGESLFSGWGMRTLASTECRYNPMSYHNGSVWPHDNALIAMGFCRYGLQEATVRVFQGLLDASRFMHLARLPELFCGFPRRPAEGPTLYPMACAPQAWASGAAILLLQACLGLSIDGSARRVSCSRPVLPPSIGELHVRNLVVGEGTIDLVFRRTASDVSMAIARRDSGIETVVTK